MRISIIIFLFATIIISCSKKDEIKQNYTQEIIDSIRVTFNKNIAEKDSTYTDIKLKEIFSLDLDSLAQDSTRFIKKVGFIDFDKNGNVYIIDKEYCKIHVYDSEGYFKKTFGNKGKGPGEFLRPGTVNIVDSILFITGNNIKEVLKFNLEGNFIENKVYADINNFPYYPFMIENKFINMVYKTQTDGKISKHTNIVSLYNEDCYYFWASNY